MYVKTTIIAMKKQNIKIQSWRKMKVAFFIYADLQYLLKKITTCYNDPKKSSTIKMNKHIASSYSLFTHCSFDATKNKLDYYRGKICMKNFFHYYEKKETIPLTNK